MIFVIEVTGKSSGRTFDVKLHTNGLLFTSGLWTCLPGYLPRIGGYYHFLSDNLLDDSLVLEERDVTIREMIGQAFFGSDYPVKIYCDFVKFTFKSGDSGEGMAFDYFKRGAESRGFVGYELTRKIKRGF